MSQAAYDWIEPAEPAGPGGGITPASPCAWCGNPGHSTGQHALLEALNRQTEFLGVIAGILEPKRYRIAQETYEDGATKATAVFESWPGGVDKLWLVERSVVYTNSTGTPTVGVYVVDSLPTPVTVGPLNQPIVPVLSPRDLHDYSNVPIAASDNTIAPVLVKGSEKLVFQWAALSAGARCAARIQIRQAWQSPD
jgi:hypothetical protein